jgi:diphthine-ammonia ligase
MCGIAGIFNDSKAVQKAAIALDVMNNRGKDGAGLSDGTRIFFKKSAEELKNEVSGIKSDIALGHVLHSLVNFVPQPIKGKGILVSNCEIYNWKEVDTKYGLDSRNDSELILKLIEKKGIAKLQEALDELDGVYSFAYMIDDDVYIARDILGIKPAWYTKRKGFAFASEKKALMRIGFASEEIEELNPRTVLCYNIKKKEITQLKNDFLTTLPRNGKTSGAIKQELKGLLLNAIAKRVPDGKFGILFSGGIDSTVIAMVCKELGVPFTCYTAALEGEGADEAEDVYYAKKVAKDLGFDLRIKTIKLSEVEEKLKVIVPLIEDTNVVKVGVGLTFFVACEEARKDGVKVIFSGLGSEELFAGYERHKQSIDVNNECLSGLLKIYERDTYRDDVITMYHNMELRLPFLDRKLADFSLKIPAKYKLDDKQNKIILRQIAEEIGSPHDYAQRKKRAAQYGSRFDKALGKLARKSGFKMKSEYLDRFGKSNPRLGVLWSSGKDSCYAMHVMKRQNYPIACLISIQSTNPDSYMFHTPNIHLAEMQAEALKLPIVVQKTTGKKEEELKDLEKAIITAKNKYRIEGIVTGALFSNYQRERVEKICDKLGLKIFSPLWHIDQEKEMRQILLEGFEFMLSSIAAEGLDKSWLARTITPKEIDKLVALNKKYGLNVAGEGGEFESLVLDAPMFQKRIEIIDFELVTDSENSARIVVKKATLQDKQIKK